MRILISLTYYSPNISGLTIYAKTLAQELTKKGYEVTILTSQYRKDLLCEEFVDGIRIVRIPVTLRIGKGSLMFSLPFHVLKWIVWADVVNCHLPQFESSIMAIMAKIFGKKVILTHHTDLSGWKGISNIASEMAVFCSQILAGILADSIIVYTKDYAEYSAYLKLFTRKLVFIYPPIRIYPIDQKYRGKLIKKIGKTDFIVGFSGRIARQKGLPYLFEAIPFIEKHIKNFKIVLAGPNKEVIGENFIKNLDIYVSKYRSRFVFLGPIPFEKMSAFYSTLDVLVLPSDDRLESLGFVQVEAMLTNCPVIATNLPGVRIPINKTGMGIIIESKNSKALAQAIIEMLTHRSTYLISPEKIKSIFNYKKTIAKYEKIFRF